MSPSRTTVSIRSPVGPILISGDEERLCRISIVGTQAEPIVETTPTAATPLLDEAVRQLEAWFRGALDTFDLPLEPSPTPRGAEMRSAIAAIGYGETASYGELARRIGSGPRAMGQACRRNPFAIVVPCHRVVGAAQSLGYYSGGDGLSTKRWLLDHERARR